MRVSAALVASGLRAWLVAGLFFSQGLGHAQQGEYSCEITGWKMAATATGYYNPISGESPGALCALLERDQVVQNCQANGTFTEHYWGVLAPVQGTDSYTCVKWGRRQECQSGGVIEQALHTFSISPDKKCGYMTVPPDQEPRSCPRPKQDGWKLGNPILPASAEKYQREEDLRIGGAHPLVFERVYRSSRVGASAGPLKNIGMAYVSSSTDGGGGGTSRAWAFPEPSVPPMGMGWSSNLVARLTLYDPFVSPGLFRPSKAYLNFGSGRYRGFKLDSSDQWIAMGSGHKDKLTAEHPDGTLGINSRFIYQAQDSDEKYVFGFGSMGPSSTHHSALLQEIRHANGWVTRIEMDPSSAPDALRPLRAINQFGQKLVFSYTPEGQISQVRHLNAADTEVAQVNYQYDADKRLVLVTYPDGSTQELHYENPENANWLTGYSRNGQRVATYSYDEQGRAVQTTRADGADRYQVDYSASYLDGVTGSYTGAKVIDPLGTERTYSYRVIGLRLNVSSATAPPADPNVPPIQYRTLNDKGLITTQYHFKGASDGAYYDTERLLPTRAWTAINTEIRTYQWHPSFRLPVQIDEAGRRTVNSYDERGNLTEQVVTDTTRGSSQVWKWTYNTAGLMASQTDPLGHTSSYAYDSAGQMTRSTNALGHVTQYGYDAAGRMNSITTPDGVVVTMGHDARGRLTSRQQTGQGVESYSYHAHGGLNTVSLPNGQQLSYHYDAAERLIRVQSNWGSQVHYTLDAMGNRIKTEVKDAQGNLVYAQSQLINALNRIEKLTEGELGGGS